MSKMSCYCIVAYPKTMVLPCSRPKTWYYPGVCHNTMVHVQKHCITLYLCRDIGPIRYVHCAVKSSGHQRWPNECTNSPHALKRERLFTWTVLMSTAICWLIQNNSWAPTKSLGVWLYNTVHLSSQWSEEPI